MKLLDKIIEAIAVTVFATSSLLICINVINRYLVLGLMRNLAKTWEWFQPTYTFVRDMLGAISVTADEIPGLLLVWIAFLGAYMAMRNEGHISFEWVVDNMKVTIKKIFISFSTLLISIFLIVLCYQSIWMIYYSGATDIETADISQGYFMLIIPLSSLLLLFAVINRFLLNFKNIKG